MRETMNTYHEIMGVALLAIGLAVPAFAQTEPPRGSQPYPLIDVTPTVASTATSTPAPTVEVTSTPTTEPTPEATATKEPFNPEPWPEYSDGYPLPNCEPGPDGRALVEPCRGKG